MTAARSVFSMGFFSRRNWAQRRGNVGGEDSAYRCLEPSERKATRPAREATGLGQEQGPKPHAAGRTRNHSHLKRVEAARRGEAIAVSGRGPAAPTPDAAAFADGWLAAAAASGQDPIRQTRFLAGRPRRRSTGFEGAGAAG